MQPTEAKKKMWTAAVTVGTSIPLRTSCFHHCYETKPLSSMLKIVTTIGRAPLCVRMRAHQGSHSECQYKLMTFGIPIKDFPVSIEGQLKSGKHKGWLERRKQKEQYVKTNPIQDGAVDMPIKFDVLLGKGTSGQQAPSRTCSFEV